MFINPVIYAALCLVALAVVVFLLYRRMTSLTNSVVDVVREHNNAKNALDNHAKAIGEMRELVKNDYDDYDDEEMYSRGSDDLGEIDDLDEIDEIDDPEIKPDPVIKKKL
jgi:hypothetical protein